MRTKILLLIIALVATMWACRKETEQSSISNHDETVLISTVSSELAPSNTPDQATITEVASKQTLKTEDGKHSSPISETSIAKVEVPKVYFLEIGSINCIPCRMMQPIMEEIEKDYHGIVNVEFYDLMKDREIGSRYNIRVMPTQVFLDANKKEFFRHEGFYPKAELVKMLDAYLAELR